MPKIPAVSGTAQTIRSLVQPDRGKSLSIAVLTDEQLRQVVLWMKEGKANEWIARTIRDYWGACSGTKWQDIIKGLDRFRERVFSTDVDLNDSPDLLFDPLAENASFVAELKEELRNWNKKIAEGDPSKAELEHVDRLGRLLADTLSNHATMEQKLGRTDDKAGADRRPGMNIEQCNMIVNHFDKPGMPDFLASAQTALEAAARKKIKPSKPRKGRKTAKDNVQSTE